MTKRRRKSRSILVPNGAKEGGKVRCSFCRTPRDRCRRLISAPMLNAYICDDCVRVAAKRVAELDVNEGLIAAAQAKAQLAANGSGLPGLPGNSGN